MKRQRETEHSKPLKREALIAINICEIPIFVRFQRQVGVCESHEALKIKAAKSSRGSQAAPEG